ncbi:MAG TPA: 50S ribosomal protein L25/general stress protein Ctc [Cyclobacteriaceae bacterium]|jgi:large subunit ribosomal protein L25|nr:50S ribosomal protein L25/general stress protein Ctc [Cytophagales bacterium]HMR58685.1 50S ribosomal protein L25/general stress protein Ctc [Cyclobacteriaceae bacterium]HRE66275.1 50S ribosomal protein L25/general stress protein Ctc [Cyclobacteriaceae bacterium]HRF33998.1 50S ribosomal protein L25/general stress protein Ctc [Cyclobacteriaceae bacterium]
MKTIEIIGYRRANLGKNDSQKIRQEGNVPCVLYGGNEQVHFYAPVILFRDLIYTNEAHFVHLNIEGEECQAIMQEVQFHPVSEIILHVDFLRISEERKIKMDIPARLVGQAPGVAKGGALVRKRASLKVYAFAKDMPDHIDVDCSSLDFHHSVKVGDLKFSGLEFLDPKQASIAVVEVPRAAKLAEETAAATPAAGAAPAAAAPAADAKKGEAPKKDEKKK